MKRAFFLLVVIIPVAALSQFGNYGQRMIQQAVEQSIVIVESGYKLQDKESGKLYGRDGKAVFNQIYSLGVYTADGLIISSAAFEPWSNDTEYDTYSDKYKPLICDIKTRDIFNGLSYSNTINTDKSKFDSLSNDVLQLSKHKRKTHLPIDDQAGSTEGWLLWVYSSDSAGIVTPTSVSLVSQTIEINAQCQCEPVEPPTPIFVAYDTIGTRHAIGGVYITAQITSAEIKLSIAGFAIHQENGWCLSTPFAKTSKKEKTSKQPDSLTPVNNNPNQEVDGGNKKKSKKK